MVNTTRNANYSKLERWGLLGVPLVSEKVGKIPKAILNNLKQFKTLHFFTISQHYQKPLRTHKIPQFYGFSLRNFTVFYGILTGCLRIGSLRVVDLRGIYGCLCVDYGRLRVV